MTDIIYAGSGGRSFVGPSAGVVGEAVGLAADNTPVSPQVPWAEGRSQEMLSHLCTHEAAHALVTRALGNPVAGVTVERGANTEGVCWSDDANLPVTVEAAAQQEREFFTGWLSVSLNKPKSGEARSRDDATHFDYVRHACIEFAAGSVAERIVWPDEEPLDATYDQAAARVMALTTVASSAAVDSFLAYARAEAEAILRSHLDVLDAIAAELEARGTLNGDELDEIIAGVVARREAKAERERRRDWHSTVERANSAATMFEPLTPR